MRLSALTLCLLPILPLTAHYGDADKSGDFRERDYGLNLLRSCPPHSVLILTQDTAFTLWYEQYVLKVRPDVLVVQRSLFTGTDIAYWYAAALRRAYPAFATCLPAPDSPPTFDAGLIQLARRAMDEGHPILFLRSFRAFLVPPRMLAVAVATAKRGDKFATPPTRPADAGGTSAKFDDWAVAHSYALPYGLGLRLFPRSVSGKDMPPPPLRDLVTTNATLWESFALDGVFVDQWRGDPDPLHYPMATQYMESIRDFGQLAESVGASDTARECYRRSSIIYPTPEASAGLKRLAVENR